MTCKDCIHYDVCHRRINSIDFLPVIKGKISTSSIMYKNCDDIERICKHFKYKSRIIELPCKVGDTVYYIANIGRTSRLLPFINEYSVLTIRHSKRTIYFDLCHKNEKHKNEKVYHTVSIEKFNKNVFTDKSKAEAKLKELNEKCLY